MACGNIKVKCNIPLLDFDVQNIIDAESCLKHTKTDLFLEAMPNVFKSCFAKMFL